MFSYQKSMFFLVVALVDSKMLTNNIVLQKCTFHRLTGKPDVYVQSRIPSICALTTCQKVLRSHPALSGLALMTQDSSREGRGLHRDSLKLSHMARAWSQILQLVCDYSNACKLHKLANLILSRGFSAGAESVLIMQFQEHLCFLPFQAPF